MFKTSLFHILLTRSFKPFVFKNVFSNTLPYHGLNNLGLYAHIPFCKSICDFCPYFKVKYDKPLAEVYKEALLK